MMLIFVLMKKIIYYFQNKRKYLMNFIIKDLIEKID